MAIKKMTLLLAAFTLLSFSLLSQAQLIVTKDPSNRTTIEHTYTENQPFNVIISNNSVTGYILQNEYVEFDVENLNDIDDLYLASLGSNNSCTSHSLVPHASAHCRLAPARNFYRSIRMDVFGLHPSKTDRQASELAIDAKNHFKITYDYITGVPDYTTKGKKIGLLGNNNIYVFEYAPDLEFDALAKQRKILAHDAYAKGPDYTCERMMQANETIPYLRCP